MTFTSSRGYYSIKIQDNNNNNCSNNSNLMKIAHTIFIDNTTATVEYFKIVDPLISVKFKRIVDIEVVITTVL